MLNYHIFKNCCMLLRLCIKLVAIQNYVSIVSELRTKLLFRRIWLLLRGNFIYGFNLMYDAKC